jgi:hypothetical protein
VLFVTVPWIAHALSPVRAIAGAKLLQEKDEAFVFGGRRMSGFVVVRDDEPPRHDIPTLHMSDFEAALHQGGIENSQALLHQTLPFGFMIAPRLEKDALSYRGFVVPPEVLERSDVPAWHFRLTEDPAGIGWGNLWFYVEMAEPLG